LIQVPFLIFEKKLEENLITKQSDVRSYMQCVGGYNLNVGTKVHQVNQQACLQAMVSHT